MKQIQDTRGCERYFAIDTHREKSRENFLRSRVELILLRAHKISYFFEPLTGAVIGTGQPV
jgi:hypothetical protein